jgi:hypothetical protein
MANEIFGLKLALLGAICLAAGVPGSGVARGADNPKEIEAQRLVLKDKTGKPRITLGVDDDGQAVISMIDADGTERLGLKVDNHSTPSVLLRDKAGKARLQLTARTDGSAFVGVLDQNQTPRIAIETESHGNARLVLSNPKQQPQIELMSSAQANTVRLYDESGKVRIQTRTSTNGPSISLADQSQHRRLVLEVRPDGAPGARFFGPNGKPRLQLSADAQGVPSLALNDENARARAEMSARPGNTTALILFDENGRDRAYLVTAPRATTLGFNDVAGKPRLVAAMPGDGNGDVNFGLSIIGPNGNRLFATESYGDRAGQFFYDSGGKMRLGMGLEPSGWSSVRVYDGQSNAERVSLNAKADQQSNLRINDGAGRLRNLVGVGTDNAPFVLLQGDHKNTMAYLFIDRQRANLPKLLVQDNKGLNTVIAPPEDLTRE